MSLYTNGIMRIEHLDPERVHAASRLLGSSYLRACCKRAMFCQCHCHYIERGGYGYEAPSPLSAASRVVRSDESVWIWSNLVGAIGSVHAAACLHVPDQVSI